MPHGGPGTPPGGRRMQALQERRAKRKQRTRIGIGLLVVAALVAVGLVVLSSRDDGDDGPVEVVRRTQQTLLMQIRGEDGLTTSNALLAQDPGNGEGAVLLVPSTVLATPPGSQSQPFRQVARTTSVASARSALSDLIGVTIDASWVLQGGALARLIDALGGVTLDVDVQVLGGPAGRQVILTPGRQEVTGGRALAYASFLAEGEPEQARVARLQELLNGLLTVLPDSEPAMRNRLESMGTGSVVDGFEAERLAVFLLALKTALDKDRLQYDTVPVITVETGAAIPSLRLDAEALRPVVDRLLAPSVPDRVREGNNRVKMFNGVGTPMLGNVVRAQLVREGLVFVGSANASRFGIATSEVQIGEPTPEAIALGERVADALGLPRSAIKSSEPTSVADVIVVIGMDYELP